MSERLPRNKMRQFIFLLMGFIGLILFVLGLPLCALVGFWGYVVFIVGCTLLLIGLLGDVMYTGV